MRPIIVIVIFAAALLALTLNAIFRASAWGVLLDDIIILGGFYSLFLFGLGFTLSRRWGWLLPVPVFTATLALSFWRHDQYRKIETAMPLVQQAGVKMVMPVILIRRDLSGCGIAGFFPGTPPSEASRARAIQILRGHGVAVSQITAD